MSLLFREPRTDKQKRSERLAGIVLAGATVLTATWVLANDQGEPAQAEAPKPSPECEWQDDVMLEVVGDQFHLPDGQLVCLHIDLVDDAQEAT